MVKVKLMERYIVPGYDRHMFPKGVVDIPEEVIEEHGLPKKAEILDDDFEYIEEETEEEETLEEHDVDRASGEAMDDVLKQAGMAGLQDVEEEPEEKPKRGRPKKAKK